MTTTCNSPTGRFSTFAAMLHGKCASRLVCSSNASRNFSDKWMTTNAALSVGSGIIHVGNFQNGSGGNIRPVHIWIQFLNQQRMRMAFFRDEFEFGFIIQRGLLRFGQPRFAERLQAREVVRRHGVIGQQRRVERELRARVGVELAGRRQIFRFPEKPKSPRASASRGRRQSNPAKSPAAPARFAPPKRREPGAENPPATGA